MDEMKTIFAVTSGSYSDYTVIAMFSTEEKAKAFMEARPDPEYNEVEEYEIDPPVTSQVSN